MPFYWFLIKKNTCISIASKTLDSLKSQCFNVQSPASNAQSPQSSFQHPQSIVQNPASRVQHPASSVRSPASSVRSPASSVQSPESSVQSRTSRVQNSESSIQSSASRVQRPTLTSRVQEFWYGPQNFAYSIYFIIRPVFLFTSIASFFSVNVFFGLFVDIVSNNSKIF